MPTHVRCGVLSSAWDPQRSDPWPAVPDTPWIGGAATVMLDAIGSLTSRRDRVSNGGA